MGGQRCSAGSMKAGRPIPRSIRSSLTGPRRRSGTVCRPFSFALRVWHDPGISIGSTRISGEHMPGAGCSGSPARWDFRSYGAQSVSLVTGANGEKVLVAGLMLQPGTLSEQATFEMVPYLLQDFPDEKPTADPWCEPVVFRGQRSHPDSVRLLPCLAAGPRKAVSAPTAPWSVAGWRQAARQLVTASAEFRSRAGPRCALREPRRWVNRSPPSSDGYSMLGRPKLLPPWVTSWR